MDTTGVIVAGILLAILVAWYILLEFEERRHKKVSDRQNRSGEPLRRAVRHEGKNGET